jgi:hypothetical protein
MKGGKTNMKKMDKSVKITLIIAVVVLAVFLMGFFGFRSLVTPVNTITGNGQSTIDAMPDLVSIYFAVITEGETSEEANIANTEIVDDLIVNLLMEGLERKDIQTQSFSIYPNYKWINDQNVEDGFIASHYFKIELSTEDSDNLGSIVDAGIIAGAGISSINFELSQEKQNEYKAEAIKLAAEDSKIKAESLAEGLGKKLGRLVSVSDSDFGYYPWPMYSGSGAVSEAAVAKEAATSIQPSEQTISASVTAVYRIR